MAECNKCGAGQRPSVVHLTPKDLAARWSQSVGHLANLRTAGKGPNYLLIGGGVRYPLDEIEDFERRALVRQNKAA